MKTRMHEATRRWSGLCVVLLIAFGGSGCAAVKGAITPFAVVRDVVDAPLVSATNGFQYFADRTKIENAPRAGVGWSWPAVSAWGSATTSAISLGRMFVSFRRRRLCGLPLAVSELGRGNQPVDSTRGRVGRFVFPQHPCTLE